MPENGNDAQHSELDTVQRRDALLLKLLKTPPQPRPKRERPKTKCTTKKR